MNTYKRIVCNAIGMVYNVIGMGYNAIGVALFK
jgi:hypothetical protein